MGERCRAIVLGVVVAACGSSTAHHGAEPSGDVGKPAVLPDEALATGFSGFALSEVNIGTCAMCGDDLCVANHFQGRVTCPYGQTQEEIDTLPADDPLRCRAADENGRVSTTPVLVPVEPQLVARRAEDAVFCSCQCDGAAAAMPSGGWCSCPGSMECASLVADLGGNANPSRYCIPRGTGYDRTSSTPLTCDKHGTDPATDCGNGRSNP